MRDEVLQALKQVKSYYYEYFRSGQAFDENSFFPKLEKHYQWPFTPEPVKSEFQKWKKELHSLYFILQIIENPEVEEIIFHQFNLAQIIQRNSREEFVDLPFLDEEEFQHLLEYLAYIGHCEWNFQKPFISFSLKLDAHDLRCSLSHYSLSSQKRSKLFLRTKKKSSIDIESFFNKKEMAQSTLNFQDEKKNIIVAGATGSGKTTFLKEMLNLSNRSDHLMILEDTAEININNKNTTYLLSNNVSNISDLLTYSLRMRPDQIVIGEIRSSEVIPYLMAMNTGHGGISSSIHANSSIDSIHRLALLFQIYHAKEGVSYNQVIKLICQSLDYIYFLENKKCIEVIKVLSSENGNPVVETIYRESGKYQKPFELPNVISLHS
ncbi:ATPase, T2SS/T4P/T4SS family [Bacteriovoracaceae bacterium]|nr:ATPase, T2SS/T4P/T4SS family [Bacteriovoracaceae bacterium]